MRVPDSDSSSASFDARNRKLGSAPILVNLARSRARSQRNEISEPTNREMRRAIKRRSSTAEHAQDTRYLFDEYGKDRRKRMNCPTHRVYKASTPSAIGC